MVVVKHHVMKSYHIYAVMWSRSIDDDLMMQSTMRIHYAVMRTEVHVVMGIRVQVAMRMKVHVAMT